MKADSVTVLQNKLKERISEIETLKTKLESSEKQTHLNGEQLKTKMQ